MFSFKKLFGKNVNKTPYVGESKVQLIKILREGTGLGLRESKEIIDLLDAKGELSKHKVLELCEAKNKNTKTYTCSDYEWLMSLIKK